MTKLSLVSLKLKFMICQTQNDIDCLKQISEPEIFAKAWNDIKQSLRSRLESLPYGNVTIEQHLGLPKSNVELSDLKGENNLVENTDDVDKKPEPISQLAQTVLGQILKEEKDENIVELYDPYNPIPLELHYLWHQLPKEIDFMDMVNAISENLKKIGLIAKKQRIKWVRDKTKCPYNQMIWDLPTRKWVICYLTSIHLAEKAITK